MTRVLRYVPYVTRNDSYYPTPDHAQVSSLIFIELCRYTLIHPRHKQSQQSYASCLHQTFILQEVL